MNPMLEWFAIFALVVFSVCCVVSVHRSMDDYYARRQYNGLRNEMCRVAMKIEELWAGEAIPSRDVCIILAKLVHREWLDIESMHDDQFDLNSH